MLGIHQMQAPFAAQFGSAAQASQHSQMVGDVNRAIGDAVDHQRDREKMAHQERIAAMKYNAEKSEREKKLEEIIARLTQYAQ